MRLGQVISFLTIAGTAPFVSTLALAAGHAEKKAGVPQLDPTYYPSQLFWLLVFFTALYVLMAKVALPRVARMADMRDDQVRRDLEQAYRMRSEAEEMQAMYMRSLRDADEKAKAFNDRIINEAKAKQETALAETQARFSRKIAETEQFLRGEKEILMNDVSNMADRLGKTIIRELQKAQG